MTTTNVNLASYRVGSSLPAAELRARNTSPVSENKIHEDDIARQYGFQGGLVPGATSYAYLAGYLVRTLGPEWAAHGTSSIALVKPVYEGEIVRLGGTVTSVEGHATRGSLTAECWVDGPDGSRRAPATAGLIWGVERTQEGRPAFARTDQRPRRPEDRLPITAATAPIGVTLPPVVMAADAAATGQYLEAIEDSNPLFREGSPFGGPLVHPGWYPGVANRVLSGNFILNAWIHTRSEIRHLGPALVGGSYHAYGEITSAFEKRGHEYVVADVLITDGADTPVARVTHTAIVVVARRE
jgi:acyl dehydratase